MPHSLATIEAHACGWAALPHRPEPRLPQIAILGRQLEYLRLPSARPRADAPSIVFLHEGLGAISLWRDFPQRIADATGCEAIVYSRHGYGGSTPLGEPRQPDYMHVEALQALPELLDRLGVQRPMLFGHSDGGSIALIHAGEAARALAGVVVMAPHVMVEEIALSGIRETVKAYCSGGLRERLGRHHRDVDATFCGWQEIWLSPAFRAWNIESYLPAIACPVLAIQGGDDEYGTMAQLERIAQQAPDVELLELPDCRHSPQRDQPEAVIAVVTAFINRLRTDSQ